MTQLDYWEENILKQEIQKKAYLAAKALISLFPTQLGSTSYFRSLAERVLTYKDIENFIVDIKNEKTRNKVKNYWEVASLKKTTLSEEIDSLIDKKSLFDLRKIAAIHNIDLTIDKKRMAKCHVLYVYFYFFYLANLAELPFKKELEDDQYVNHS